MSEEPGGVFSFPFLFFCGQEKKSTTSLSSGAFQVGTPNWGRSGSGSSLAIWKLEVAPSMELFLTAGLGDLFFSFGRKKEEKGLGRTTNEAEAVAAAEVGHGRAFKGSD